MSKYNKHPNYFLQLEGVCRWFKEFEHIPPGNRDLYDHYLAQYSDHNWDPTRAAAALYLAHQLLGHEVEYKTWRKRFERRRRDYPGSIQTLASPWCDVSFDDKLHPREVVFTFKHSGVKYVLKGNQLPLIHNPPSVPSLKPKQETISQEVVQFVHPKEQAFRDLALYFKNQHSNEWPWENLIKALKYAVYYLFSPDDVQRTIFQEFNQHMDAVCFPYARMSLKGSYIHFLLSDSEHSYSFGVKASFHRRVVNKSELHLLLNFLLVLDVSSNRWQFFRSAFSKTRF